MKWHIQVSAAAAMSLLFLTSCGGGGDPVTVRDAVVTLPAVPGQAGAAYFTVEAGREPVRLTAVESDRAQRFELHETVTENGRSGMRPLAEANAEAATGRPLVFAPGGKHAMVYGLDPTLKVGDRVTLTLRFSGVEAVTTEAEVRGPGQAHAGH